MRLPALLTNGQDAREPLFDRRIIIGGMTAAGLVLSILMRSQCNLALQACPQCISLGMPIQCTIADAISILAISILGTMATVLWYQQPMLPL